jgi:hypothetical protein
MRRSDLFSSEGNRFEARALSRVEGEGMSVTRISFSGLPAAKALSMAASCQATAPQGVCLLHHNDMTAPVYRSQGIRPGEANLSQPTISNFDFNMRVMYGITGANYDSDAVSDICA